VLRSFLIVELLNSLRKPELGIEYAVIPELTNSVPVSIMNINTPAPTNIPVMLVSAILR
jgi:hypothetical protein